MQHNFFDKQPLKTISRTHLIHSRTKRHTYLIVLITNLLPAINRILSGVIN